MKFIPERLVGARAKNGFTQQKVADLTGVSLRSVQGWEKGEAEPRPGAVQSLAAVLRVPATQFYEPGSAGVFVAEASAAYNAGRALEDSAHEYLRAFLDTCEGKTDRLQWTRVELERHFPLNHWARLESARSEYLNRKLAREEPEEGTEE